MGCDSQFDDFDTKSVIERSRSREKKSTAYFLGVEEDYLIIAPSYKNTSRVVADVNQELGEAVGKYPPFNSLHEAYAVLQEEVDEFWDEVKAKPAVRAERKAQIRKELIQVAAMAVRTIVDCID